MTHLYIIFYY